MSRSGYSDDCENLGLWRQAVANAISGKRGQAFIRELAAALDAMPVRRLTENELQRDGEVCALGSVGQRRGVEMAALDSTDHEMLASVFDVPRSLIQEIEYENDEWRDGRETPEHRWERMRKWAADNLRPSPSASEKPTPPSVGLSKEGSETP